MVGKRPHQIQRTTSMSQIRAPPASRPRIAAATTEMGSSVHSSSSKDYSDGLHSSTVGVHIHSRGSDDPVRTEMHLDESFGLSTNIHHSFLRPVQQTPYMAKHGATQSFMDACYSCKRPLSHGRDIFMYRGDVAFCTEECRLRQISCDERRQQCSISASHKGNGTNNNGNSNCSRKVTSAGAS